MTDDWWADVRLRNLIKQLLEAIEIGDNHTETHLIKLIRRELRD